MKDVTQNIAWLAYGVPFIFIVAYLIYPLVVLFTEGRWPFFSHLYWDALLHRQVVALLLICLIPFLRVRAFWHLLLFGLIVLAELLLYQFDASRATTGDIIPAEVFWLPLIGVGILLWLGRAVLFYFRRIDGNAPLLFCTSGVFGLLGLFGVALTLAGLICWIAGFAISGRLIMTPAQVFVKKLGLIWLVSALVLHAILVPCMNYLWPALLA
jgi:hypothetical protein